MIAQIVNSHLNEEIKPKIDIENKTTNIRTIPSGERTDDKHEGTGNRKSKDSLRGSSYENTTPS